MTRVLVIDNYDSFVYTLNGYLQQLGAETHVIRNDEVSVGEPRPGRGVRACDPRVGAEEPHERAHAVQPDERGGEAFVVDVALGVDRERVPSQHVPGGPGFDPG